MRSNFCEYKRHFTTDISMSHYWDNDNGLPEKGLKICRACYAEHILKFYPDSLMAKHIQANPDEYKSKEL